MKACNVAPEILKELQNAKTVGELRSAIFNFQNVYRSKTIVPCLTKFKRDKKSFPLELEQEFYHKKNFMDDCVRWLHALFAAPSRNPEVVKIEEILRNQYGVKLALLGNDLPNAQKILKAVQIAKSKGVKIPEEFIVSHYKTCGEHLRTSMGSADTVIIPSSLISNLAGNMQKKMNLGKKI